MTVQEFYKNCDCKGELRVKSGYNDKILCYAYDPSKHIEIGKRELHCVWADVQVSSIAAFGNYAKPIMVCYVDGHEEYAKEKAKKDGADNER